MSRDSSDFSFLCKRREGSTLMLRMGCEQTLFLNEGESDNREVIRKGFNAKGLTSS